MRKLPNRLSLLFYIKKMCLTIQHCDKCKTMKMKNEIIRTFGAGGVVQAVEYMLSMCEALRSNPVACEQVFIKVLVIQ